MSRGKALEPVLQIMIIRVATNGDGLHGEFLASHGRYFLPVWLELAAADGQHDHNFHFSYNAYRSMRSGRGFPIAFLRAPDDRQRIPLHVSKLGRTSHGKSQHHAESKPQDTAVELPQPVLQPISPTQFTQTPVVRRHGRLVREEAIDDQRVEGDDNGGRGNDD